MNATPAASSSRTLRIVIGIVIAVIVLIAISTACILALLGPAIGAANSHVLQTVTAAAALATP